jgi:hypothetical protein
VMTVVDVEVQAVKAVPSAQPNDCGRLLLQYSLLSPSSSTNIAFRRIPGRLASNALLMS